MSTSPARKFIGKISSARGLRGEFKVYTAIEFDAAVLHKIKFVFISKIHASVERARYDAPHLILQVTEVTDRTAAEKLVGLDVFADEILFETKKGERIFLRELIGFEVFDQGICVGRVADIATNAAQDLLLVRSAENEFEIPFVDGIICTVDWEKRVIETILPPGLMDLE